MRDEPFFSAVRGFLMNVRYTCRCSVAEQEIPFIVTKVHLIFFFYIIILVTGCKCS